MYQWFMYLCALLSCILCYLFVWFVVATADSDKVQIYKVYREQERQRSIVCCCCFSSCSYSCCCCCCRDCMCVCVCVDIDRSRTSRMAAVSEFRYISYDSVALINVQGIIV